MKKFTELKPGDLISAQQLIELFPWITIETAYEWAKAYPGDPENFPPCAKIGRTWIWPKRELIDFVNRKLADRLAS